MIPAQAECKTLRDFLKSHVMRLYLYTTAFGRGPCLTRLTSAFFYQICRVMWSPSGAATRSVEQVRDLGQLEGFSALASWLRVGCQWLLLTLTPPTTKLRLSIVYKYRRIIGIIKHKFTRYKLMCKLGVWTPTQVYRPSSISPRSNRLQRVNEI